MMALEDFFKSTVMFIVSRDQDKTCSYETLPSLEKLKIIESELMVAVRSFSEMFSRNYEEEMLCLNLGFTLARTV